MSYIGRLEIRAHKDGDEIEILYVNLRANRAHVRSGYAGNTLIEEVCAEEFVKDTLKNSTDGVHDITGAYHEHWSQDYWGEWDGGFSLENQRVRFRGELR